MSGNNQNFKGKVVLVTGGSRGIGKAIATEFARRGTDVVFNYIRSHDSANAVKNEIESLGVRCLRVRAHLGDSKNIKKLFSTIEREFGKLDFLINNAASGVQRSATDLEEKHWDWTMDINAKAPWLCAIEASRLMTNGGAIINISSMGSQRVLPYYFSVGTSKAALEALTRYLAVELASKGITVNAVSGGYVNTGALNHFPNREDMLAEGQKTLEGRILTGNDIAQVVCFLCSKEAEMIRGQVIIVDGGTSLHA